MQSNPHKLTVIDGETLMDKRLPPTKFCVDTLLPQGLCILGGSPKVGKSWLVLDLCVHVAQGTPLWGLDVTRGDVLYLCLEDSERRIQERLNTITDNVPDGMYFATGCTSIESGVCDWLRDFKRQHPALCLVAIDTFQLIRTPTPEVSYGGDYAELRVLKKLADELGICLLLVHHLRKMNDRDPVNKLSGSTGISGAVDAIFVLDKNERIERFATLYASGRDIRDRKIQLELDKDACVWTLIADSLTMPETMLPDEMAYVFGFVWRSKNHGFVGTNTELAQHVSSALGKEVNPKGLKQMMNRYRYQLEDLGVFFESKRSNGQKYVVVRYVPPADGASSDSSASVSSDLTDSVPYVPCVPAGDVG